MYWAYLNYFEIFTAKSINKTNGDVFIARWCAESTQISTVTPSPKHISTFRLNNDSAVKPHSSPFIYCLQQPSKDAIPTLHKFSCSVKLKRHRFQGDTVTFTLRPFLNWFNARLLEEVRIQLWPLYYPIPRIRSPEIHYFDVRQTEDYILEEVEDLCWLFISLLNFGCR